ncbi:hypothetical protein E4U15_003526 [Claviceps sp. LM218 group G6]|nr:hypothetical protein E4U15_003526 [Claviceps sp. LM218 group G6]
MQDQSPALLESNLLAISKIMPEMRRKAKKHRKPRYKLQLEQCHRQGGTFVMPARYLWAYPSS